VTCYRHIHDTLGLPQPTASRHLAYLRKSGLVDARRDGVWMHYRVAPSLDPMVKKVIGAAIAALLEIPATGQDRKQFDQAFGQLYVRCARRGLLLRASRVMTTVLFACVHNAGRSQMAAALFNQLADPSKARAISAGTNPAPRVHHEVVEAMLEVGADLSSARGMKLTADFA